MQRVNYEKLRAELVHYASPEPGEAWSAETFADGVLEFLVISGFLSPERVEGWPDDGLVQLLLDEMRGASA